MAFIRNIAIVAALVFAGVGHSIQKHEQRNLRVGSIAATQELMTHENWDAVKDNYVFVHNAFRNDLQRIIVSCENDQFVQSELEEWEDILNVHSRFEDEVIVPALQARLKERKLNKSLPGKLVNGNDHKSVKTILQKSIKCSDDAERLKLLKELATRVDLHLEEEEKIIMPLLMKSFTTRELWAIDSFIVNPKLGYCDQELLIKITKWWFGNISIHEMMELFLNFVKVGMQPAMPIEQWKKIQDDIPVLQKYPTEDLIS